MTGLDVSCKVVIPAAGMGRRMGADRPKQYLPLAGRTVIEHTIACFDGHPAVSGIVVAIAPDDRWWPELDIRTQAQTPLSTVPGGEERAHSVLSALDCLVDHCADDDWVLVHDAARPCLARADLDRLIGRALSDAVGGLLAAPVRDTMKRGDGRGRVARTEERAGLWHALTPQMFRYGLLRRALGEALASGAPVTDESSAVERLGLLPLLVEGAATNLKITHPDDLPLAERLLAAQGRAVGSGAYAG